MGAETGSGSREILKSELGKNNGSESETLDINMYYLNKAWPQ